MNSTLSFQSRRAARRALRISSHSRRAFSLIEMLVALAVFLVLLTAVFVPIKLAGDLSGVGTARSNTQQAAVDGIRMMRSDISKAIVILPNDRMAGVTDKYPYFEPPIVNGATTTLQGNSGFPYLRDPSGYQMPTTATGSGQSSLNACNAGAVPSPNTARLDLILPANGSNSNSIDPNIRSNNVLVSYYSRRRDMTKAFDPIENPVVLYRAQIPFQTYNAAGQTVPFIARDRATSYNANLSNNRFTPRNTTTGCTPDSARGLQWLTMNQYGEFDLTSLCLPPAGSPAAVPNSSVPVFGSHQLVLPRDTVLITPNASLFAAGTPPTMGTSLVPDTTFVCADSNKDGKIDTVTIQLSVGQYDENSANRRTAPTPSGPTPSGATPAPRSILVPQVARTVTETVFDPNIQ